MSVQMGEDDPDFAIRAQTAYPMTKRGNRWPFKREISAMSCIQGGHPQQQNPST